MKTEKKPWAYPAKLLLLLCVMVVLGACTTHKKKKCNTCPKWTSEHVEFEHRLDPLVA
ncbi:MAG TPA: hypothetical protein VKY29_06750 [Cryomorphaceae bacterium]|nr:hypothetical protein [Cryomorphaceae bacterium]